MHTLNALAAKLSPTQTQNVDGNANRIALAAAAAAAAASLTTANGSSTSSNGYTLIFSNVPDPTADGYRTTDRRNREADGQTDGDGLV